MLVIFLSLQRLEITEQRIKNKDQRARINEGNELHLMTIQLNIRIINAISGI
jgi:hypothetical protein